MSEKKRSVEWLRGAIEALSKWGWSHRATIQQAKQGYYTLLAEAEAREARPTPEPIPGTHAALAGLSIRPKPTAAEVIAKLRVALEGALRLDPTCDHTDTHRGGAIWTICDQCDKKWADDEGGFQPDPPNKFIVQIEEAIAIAADWEGRG